MLLTPETPDPRVLVTALEHARGKHQSFWDRISAETPHSDALIDEFDRQVVALVVAPYRQAYAR